MMGDADEWETVCRSSGRQRVSTYVAVSAPARREIIDACVSLVASCAAGVAVVRRPPGVFDRTAPTVVPW